METPEDIENIMKYLDESLNNENNKSIFDTNINEIEERKLEIINELNLTREEKIVLLKKLKDYRYIDELKELHIGAYIRWIKYKDEESEIKLTNGAILNDIKFEENTNLLLRNNYNRFFSVSMADNLIFQKLTNQEKIILYAIENIDKLK